MNWQTTKYKGIEISTNSNIQSYIVHFLDLSNPPENLEGIDVCENLDNRYNEALNRSRKYHGRKFHTRTYGGGIGFPAEELAKKAIDNYLEEVTK